MGESRPSPLVQRPPNAGKWGDEVTPHRRLWYIIALCIWLVLTLALFAPFGGSVDNFSSAIGLIVAIIGGATVPYIFMKHFVAPKTWLLTYLDPEVSGRWLEVFAAEESITRWLKARKDIQRLTNWWKTYSRPKQDRWHRNEEDLQEVEPPNGSISLQSRYAGDGSLAFGYTIDMAPRARTTIDSETAYEILDNKYIKVFRELSIALPKISGSAGLSM